MSRQSRKQYESHCAAQGRTAPGQVQGVTFRAARTAPPPAPETELEGILRQARELRDMAVHCAERACEFEDLARAKHGWKGEL